MTEDDKQRSATCPYRDEIREMAECLPKINKKLNEIHDRLFIDNNGDSLRTEIRRNTEFREELEQSKKYGFIHRYERYSFWFAIVALLITTVLQIIFNN